MFKNLIALSLLCTTLFPHLSLVANPATPEQISSCLDESDYRKVLKATVYQQIDSLLAVELEVEYRGYQYIAMQVIELSRDNQCVSRYSDAYFEQPLSQLFDIETAKQLRLGWEKRRLNIDQPFDETQAWLSQNDTALAPESKWAFKQLNFDISNTTSCEKSTLRQPCY